jgi:large-conductance mechanosensitive channel
MLKEFRDFVFRGNIVELAVAFVMGWRSPRSSTRWWRTS